MICLLYGIAPGCLDASPQLRGYAVGQLAVSVVNWFEVEISQIHVAVRQYVNRENIFPFVETDFEKLRRQIPVVPLTPSNRVCGIACCGDLERSGCVFAVHI